MKYKYFFVDPMSYNNLELYDLNLLSKFNKKTLYFFGNKKIKKKIKFSHKLIYNYSDKKVFNKFFSYFISQITLFFFIYKKKPKLIHFQWFKIPALDFFLLFFIKFCFSKVKIVYTAHNILPHDSGNKFRSIYYKIYNLVDAIIVHDDYSKKALSSMFKIKSDKISVIRHGLLKIPRDEDKVNLNSLKFSYLNDKIIFLFTGNISKYKGVDLLIDTWNQSVELNTNNKIHLIIAGNDKNNLLNKINNFQNITIINKFLSNEEFISFINLSDIILLPYLKISQSGVLMSVLQEEKRVLVSNIGGLIEPLRHGDVGWVLEKLNVESFKNIILKIIQDTEKTDNISDFKEIKAHYSWSVISNKTHELYLKLI